MRIPSLASITTFLFLFVLFIASFALRSSHIFDNHPFWVDEFGTASQAEIFLKYGFSAFHNPSVIFETHNITTHILAAAGLFFGPHEESSIRFPFVLIGSLVPLAVYLLASKMVHKLVGATAALLTTFSYFEITWSRQARGYILVQLLILIATWLYFTWLEKKNPIAFIALFITCIVGLATHAFFTIFIGALVIHYCLFYFSTLIRFLKKPYIYILIALLAIYFVYSGLFQTTFNYFSRGFINANNVWYYHSFLWREYGLISYLALMGMVVAFFTRRAQISFIIIYIALHLFFINFMLAPYISRYLLPIFPFLFIGIAYLFGFINDSLKAPLKKISFPFSQSILPLFFAGVIIVNGYKFDMKPNPFYSVNHDFREIAVVDYDQVYKIIKEKGELSEGKTAVIDTWSARTEWYTGSTYPAIYIFRWINEPGLTNGLERKTNFTVNARGEKVLPRMPNVRFIGELSDLKMAMNTYKKGFIFIDDTSLPKDVLDYVEKNFKKELYLEHYPLDDNPESIWPATLYSWGIE